MTALRELTTIRIGGKPSSLVTAHSRDELVAAASEVWATGENWLVLGGGSNVVAADDLDGWNVIQVANAGIEELGAGLLRVDAGENWDSLVEFAISRGLGGFESLSGIPGLAGAAPIQNIGAYGSEISQTLVQLEFLDYETGELYLLSNEDCEFGYRDSVFKRGRRGVVTWVEFQLEVGADAEAMASRRAEVLALRAAKGMVLNAADLDTHSCGSFFVNPIVSDRVARTIPLEAPRWESEADDGLTVKLSAAWLIEHSGIARGFSLAGSKAAISSKHTLAITNRGEASAEEVLQLATYVQTRVANTFGINLKPEPTLVGFLP